MLEPLALEALRPAAMIAARQLHGAAFDSRRLHYISFKISLSSEDCHTACHTGPTSNSLPGEHRREGAVDDILALGELRHQVGAKLIDLLVHDEPPEWRRATSSPRSPFMWLT
jgi:hypothetical protein